MIDHSKMRLGKRPAKHDPRRLKLSKYLQALPEPPDSKSWITPNCPSSWGMLLNDSLGDCTIAGVGHAIQSCSAAIGPCAVITDADVLKYYEAWDGYNPADPSTDQGGVEPDVLDAWRQQTFNGHILKAYVDPDPQNDWHVKWAITLFGGLYIGLNLPVSCQSQQVWDVVAIDGGTWGGHCVWVPAYDGDGLVCVTWGQLKRMTWAFWKKYCDESHALLLQDFLNASNQSVDAVDFTALEADLVAVMG